MLKRNSIFEMNLRCPSCNTEIKLIADVCNTVIITCQGCSRGIVFQENNVYTVPFSTVVKLINKYGVRTCGKIVKSNISNKVHSLRADNNISSLKKILKEDMDVKDFIKKIS